MNLCFVLKALFSFFVKVITGIAVIFLISLNKNIARQALTITIRNRGNKIGNSTIYVQKQIVILTKRQQKIKKRCLRLKKVINFNECKVVYFLHNNKKSFYFVKIFLKQYKKTGSKILKIYGKPLFFVSFIFFEIELVELPRPVRYIFFHLTGIN